MSRRLTRMFPALLPWSIVFAAVAGPISTFQAKGEEMSYAEVRKFLARYTDLVELTDGEGARVAICPEWQGRVMTSTCGGLDGPSFGLINREYVEAGEHSRQFANFGGEDRLWLSPEGGPFSLWFKPGQEQSFDNWETAPAINEGAWNVVSGTQDPYYRCVRKMELQNASGTNFTLDVTRDIRLLNDGDLCASFGPQAAELMAGDDVQMVGYETINVITNRGSAMTKEGGLVSIWILGMMNVGESTVVILPYRSGAEGKLGPVVKSDYFGDVPPDRLKITPEAILFRCDGQYRSKLGTSQQRARNVAGSFDFASGLLTLVHFSMPDDPTQSDYMNNMWGANTPDSYVGDVANTYNDGPPEPGKKGLGPFYEIESLSPAAALGTGQSLTHHHRTVHLKADPATLASLAEQVLGVKLEAVREAMLGE